MSLIKEGSTAEIHWNGETPTPAKFQLSHTCGGIPPAADPTVSKDAEGAYDETFVWTPDKKADVDTVYSAGGGESGEVNYTVSVSHDEGTVSNVELSGTIKVTNPNDAAIELDSVDGPAVRRDHHLHRGRLGGAHHSRKRQQGLLVRVRARRAAEEQADQQGHYRVVGADAER